MKEGKRNAVNMNINPCKMCMPMGAVQAFKGIEGGMTILHGSQGCSTYIRRHMATHYNEPIDIGSSSMSEQGTVYGGSDQLKKAINNMTKTYSPKLVGIATTCLAETIGEDIARIVLEYKEENKDSNLKLIPVSTAGYGGTQVEGYYHALMAMAKSLVKMSNAPGCIEHHKINVIVPLLSPADARQLKAVFEAFGVEITLFPDVSETLDAPYEKNYPRIAIGGTPIEEIEKMSGATATIELGLTQSETESVGVYLQETYGVPLYRVALPMGIRATDAFLQTVSEVTGKDIPEALVKQRKRMLDAMIDSHKYNGEGRAILYGEAEQVLSLTHLCAENGIKPLCLAVGSKNNQWKESLPELEEDTVILSDIDFETIEGYVKTLSPNLLIGNSDGRRLEEKFHVPIVRVGFPIHDRVGGQRMQTLFYEGSLSLLDKITNAVLEQKEEKYRKSMYDQYYKPLTEKKVESMPHIISFEEQADAKKIIAEKTKAHPCFGQGARECARMHLPVAPKCNIKCNYCSRKFDCPNESRPGVTTAVLSPEEALKKFIAVKEKMPNLTVVGIAGPGDALANPEETMETLRLIRKEDPNITFCLSTNGLMLPFYAKQLVELGVSHVTVTVNAVDPEIGSKVYGKVNYFGKTYQGLEGATILLHNQLSGIQYLTSQGIVLKVNIVMLKGINDHHIPEVVKKVKECGAYITNIMQMIPVEGSAFWHLPLVSNKELKEMRNLCECDLKQMHHCRQCRADAIGTLDEDQSIHFREKKGCGGSCGGAKTAKTYRFAVASKTGMNIDQHFGHAEQFFIYKCVGDEVTLEEQRVVSKYCSGTEDCGDKESKFEVMAEMLKDCDGVLVLRAGLEPTRKLSERGIKLIQTYAEIREGIREAVKEIEASKKVVNS